MQLNIWKNLKYSLLVLLTVLTATGFSQVMVESLEILPDKTIVVKISGISYRGLPAPKLREVVQQQEELKLFKADYSSLLKQFDLYRSTSEQERQASALKWEKEREKITLELNFYISQYGKEVKLRESFQKELEKCRKIIFWRIC